MGKNNIRLKEHKSHIYYSLQIIFVILSLFVYTNRLQAATVTISSNTNWNAITSGSGTAGQPNSTDDVVIASGAILTVNVPTATCASLTVNAASVANGVSIASPNSLTVIGAITMNMPTTAVNSTIDVADGSLTAASIAIPGSATASRNCIVKLSTGTITVSGNISFSGTAAQAQLTFYGSGTLNIAGNLTAGGTFTKSTGTVNYNGAAQTVGLYSYNNLSLTGSGIKTITGLASVTGNFTTAGTISATTTVALAIGGNLTIGSGTTITIPAFALTVTGTSAINGSLVISGTAGTKTFTGAVTIATGASLAETIVSTLSFGNDVTNNGTITEIGATAVTIAGNLTNNGTFTATTGVHTLSGSAKTITGTITIPSLAVTGSYTNTNTLTVSTALTGATLTQGSGATLNIGGTSTITTLTATALSNTVSYTGAAQTVKAIAYNNLTLSGSGVKTLTGITTIAGNLTLSGTASTTTAANFTIGGNLTIGNGTTLNIGAFTFGVTGTTTVGGGTSGTLAFTGAAGVSTFTGNLTMNGGTLSCSVAASMTAPNLTVNAATVNTLSGTNGTFTINGLTLVAGTLNITSTGGTKTFSSVTVNNAGTWNNTGSVLSSINGNLIINTGGIFTQGAAALTVSGTTTVSGTLSMTGTGAKTFTGDLTMNGGTLTCSAAATVSLSTFTIASATTNTFSGNNGVFTISGLTSVNGTLNFTSTGGTKTFSALTVNSAGVWNSSGTVASTISGNLIINDGGSFTQGGSALTVNGTTTIGQGLSGSLTVTSATGTKTFTGAVIIGSGASLVETAACTLTFGSDVTINGTVTESGAAVINIGGSLIDNGTYNASTGVHTFSGLANILSGTISIAKITMNGSYTNSNSLTVGTALIGTGTLTQALNAILTIGGTSTITNLDASTNINSVIYNGAAQTVKATVYNNLTLSGSGAKTLTLLATVKGNLILSGTVTATTANNLTVAGNVTIGNGTTLNIGAFTFGVTGTTTVGGGTSGTLAFTGAGGASTFTGDVSLNGGTLSCGVAATQTMNTLTVTAGTNTFAGNNGTFTINGLTTVNSQLKITASGGVKSFSDINIGSYGNWNNTGNMAATISGNLLINGAFTSGTGIYTMTGTGKTISGSIASTSFGSLSPNGTITNLIPSLTVTTALGGTGSLTLSANNTLYLGGSSAISTLDATTNTGTTVVYNGAAQTVKGIPYYNLILSGTGVKTLGALSTITGNFSTLGTASATTTSAITVSGNVSIGNGTTFTVAAFPITINGTTTVGGGTSGNFKISSATGTKTFTGAVTIASGGTLSESAAAPLIFGSDLINNGTYTENGAAVVSIAGNITNNNVFTASTGIHTLTGTTKNITGTISIPSLTINGTYTNNTTLTVGTALIGTGSLTQASNATLNIGGTSTISTLSANASGNTVMYNKAGAQIAYVTIYNNLSLGGSGIKTITNTTVNGTLSMEGTATATGTVASYGSGATLQYKGTAAQTAGSEFPTTFSGSGGLIVNNPLGLTIVPAKTIANQINLISGKVTTANITAATSISSGGWINGNLLLTIPTGSPTVTFCIGDVNRATPVTLTFNAVSASGTITMSSTGAQHPNINTSGLNPSHDVKRYYTIANSGTVFTNYSATFGFVSTDIMTGSTTSNFVVKNYTGSWTSLTTGSQLPTSTQATGITTFNTFAIGEVQTLDHFAFALVANQVNNLAFTGINTLTACDISGNPIYYFDASTNNVSLTTTLAGALSLTAGGSVLSHPTDFSAGIANLTSLGLLYVGGLGTGTITATANTGQIGTSGNLTINAGALHISAISPQTAGTAFNITVTSTGNVTSDITLQLSLATGTGTLGGTLSATMLNGTNSITISGVTYSKAEGGVSVTVTQTTGSPTLTPYTSNTFTVSPGIATTLSIAAITLQPLNTGFSVVITSLDANGNISPVSSTTPISLTRATGTGSLGGTVSGSITSGTSSTTISGVTYNTIENGVSITATGAPLTAATSNTFAVVAQPNASFSPLSLCGIGSDGNSIPVTFTATTPVSLPYTLNYTIGGVAQTPIVVNALPYSLPIPNSGTYILTGYSYQNGGTFNGSFSSSPVQIYDIPTTANAGTAITGASITLAANAPSIGTGSWSIINNDGIGSVVSPTSNTSVFTGTKGYPYTLRWTISNSSNCTSTSDVVVTIIDTYYYQGGDYTSLSSWNSLANGSGSNPINFNGTGITYVIPAGTTLTLTSNWNLSSITGVVLLNNGTLDASTYTLSFPTITNNGTTKFSGASNGSAINSGNVEFYGTTQTIPGGTYSNVTISGGGTKTLSSSTTINGNLTIIDGILADGGYQINGNILGNATLSIAGGCSLLLGNGISATSFPTNISSGNITLSPNSSISYMANANQTVSPIPTYQNLTLTTGGLKNITGTTTISGDLTISSATMNFGSPAHSVSVAGDLIGTGGTINMSSATHSLTLSGLNNALTTLTTDANTNNSTITYNRSGNQYIFPSSSYSSVTLSGTGNKSLVGTTSIIRNVIIGGNTVFDDGGNICYIQGDLTNNNIHSGAGEIVLNGTVGQQSIICGTNAVFGFIDFNNTNGGQITGNQITIDSLVITTGTLTFNAINTSLSVTRGTSISGNASFQNTNGTKTFNSVNITATGKWISGVDEDYAIYGNFAIASGGTFIPGNGKYTFSGALDQSITVPNGFNLTINKPGGSVTSGSTLSLTNLSLVSGNSGTFTAPASLSIAGDISLLGGSVSWGTDVILNGSVQQKIDGTTIPSFTNLKINNTASGDAIVLYKPITITNVLTLSQGIIKTDLTNNLIMETSATLAGTPSDQNFIDGPMTYMINSTTPITAVFPIGQIGTLHRADITVSQTTSSSNSYTCEYFRAPATVLAHTIPSGSTLTNVSHLGYWHLAKSHEILDGSGNDADIASASILLYYDLVNDNVQDTTHLLVAKSNGTTNEWMNLGRKSVNAQSVGSIAFGAFCDLSLASDCSCNSLPISLTQFTVKNKVEDILIEWQTASETNNDYFTLERSVDGKIFTPIYSCKGEGSSTEINNYSFLDNDNLIGTIYYRLKQTDFDGQSTYSTIKSIVSNKLAFGFTVYPNPSSIDNLKVIIACKKDESIVLQITNTLGQIMYRGEMQSLGSAIMLNIKDICQLQSGVFYTITVISEGKTVSKKIAVE